MSGQTFEFVDQAMTRAEAIGVANRLAREFRHRGKLILDRDAENYRFLI